MGSTRSYFLTKELAIEERIEDYVDIYSKSNTITIKDYSSEESICMSRDFFINFINTITEGPDRELRKGFKDALNFIYGGFNPCLTDGIGGPETDTYAIAEQVLKQYKEMGKALDLFGDCLDSASNTIEQFKKYYKINSED